MTDDAEAKKGGRTGHLMALAIMTLFASMLVTAFAFKGYPGIHESLGMTELPWITDMAIRFIYFFMQYWFVVGPVFAVAAVLAGSGILGRPRWMAVGFVFFVALTFPAVVYFALHAPIVELQKKLGGN